MHGRPRAARHVQQAVCSALLHKVLQRNKLGVRCRRSVAKRPEESSENVEQGRLERIADFLLWLQFKCFINRVGEERRRQVEDAWEGYLQAPSHASAPLPTQLCLSH
jgi:hypothetical protein